MFDVWKNVLEEIEQSIPPYAFATWFKDVKISSITDDKIVIIEVPNVFKQRQIRTKYDQIVRDALTHNSVDFSDVSYVISSSQTTVKPRSREISLNSREVPLSEIIKKKSNSARISNPSLSKNRVFSSELKPNYLMSNFVITSSNEVAVSVAQAVVKNLGTKYNPFFVYGGPGLGKTHLVQALGNEILKTYPDCKVLYTSTSDFYSEFIDSIRKTRSKNVDIDNFNKKYANIDVLIVDDFQMIAGKTASQNAFFDIFNDLYQKNKQIIITCDRLPNQLKEIDERLSSRLAWSGAYDLQMPSFEDKCTILRAKAEFEDVEIEDEAIEYIANDVKTNIRDLEGEFRKILAYADFKKTTPLAIIQSGLLTTPNTDKNRLVTPKKVLSTVANFYNITVDELCSGSRVTNIKNARQIAMYLLAEELKFSTTKAAAEVGLKDHTTAMHGINRIKDLLNVDFSLRDQIASIREKLYE